MYGRYPCRLSAVVVIVVLLVLFVVLLILLLVLVVLVGHIKILLNRKYTAMPWKYCVH